MIIFILENTVTLILDPMVFCTLLVLRRQTTTSFTKQQYHHLRCTLSLQNYCLAITRRPFSINFVRSNYNFGSFKLTWGPKSHKNPWLFLNTTAEEQQFLKSKNWKKFVGYLGQHYSYNAFLHFIWQARADNFTQIVMLNYNLPSELQGYLELIEDYNRLYKLTPEEVWIKYFIFYIVNSLPTQFLNQLLKLSVIPRNENTITGNFERATEADLLNRKYWLVTLLFENYKNSPEDFVITEDKDFYFEINYHFCAFVLILQQIKSALSLCNNSLDYIKVIFLLYFNSYVFDDSLYIWQANSLLFSQTRNTTLKVIGDPTKYSKMLQRDFLAFVLPDFLKDITYQLNWEQTTWYKFQKQRELKIEKEDSFTAQPGNSIPSLLPDTRKHVGLPKRPPKKLTGIPPAGLFFPRLPTFSYKRLKLLRRQSYFLTKQMFDAMSNYYKTMFKNNYFLLRAKLFISNREDTKVDRLCAYYNNISSFFENNKLPFYHSSPWLLCNRATLLKYLINFIVHALPNNWFRKHKKFFYQLVFALCVKKVKKIKARKLFVAYLFNSVYSIAETNFILVNLCRKFLMWHYRNRYQYGETAILKQWVISLITDKFVSDHLGDFLYFYEIASLTRFKPIRVFRSNDKWLDRKNLGYSVHYSNFYARLCRFQFASCVYEDILRYILRDNRNMLSRFAKTKTLGISQFYPPLRLQRKVQQYNINSPDALYGVSLWSKKFFFLSFIKRSYSIRPTNIAGSVFNFTQNYYLPSHNQAYFQNSIGESSPCLLEATNLNKFRLRIKYTFIYTNITTTKLRQAQGLLTKDSSFNSTWF